MIDSQELEQLVQDICYLKDRTEILDCVARHARGCDRHDPELLASAYHTDSTDEHGHVISPGPMYPKWANKVHALGSEQNMHHITTHRCEIDGDQAHCESYVMVLLVDPGARTGRIMSGRYIDRLERRDGEWKIALRRTTVDFVMAGDASLLKAPVFTQQGYVKGMRDQRDVSYQRPLTLDETLAERW